MTTLNRTRGPVKPAQGTVRWLRRPLLPTGLGRLAITSGRKTTEYDLGQLFDYQGRPSGWRLVKDDDTAYHLPADLSRCSCPDREFMPDRPGGCRHMQALRAALAALEQGVSR